MKINNYYLYEYLNKGAFGKVYKAVDIQTN